MKLYDTGAASWSGCLPSKRGSTTHRLRRWSRLEERTNNLPQLGFVFNLNHRPTRRDTPDLFSPEISNQIQRPHRRIREGRTAEVTRPTTFICFSKRLSSLYTSAPLSLWCLTRARISTAFHGPVAGRFVELKRVRARLQARTKPQRDESSGGGRAEHH